MTLGLPAGAAINCTDNSGAKNLFLIATFGFGAKLNRLTDAGNYYRTDVVGCLLMNDAGVGDMVVASVKKGKPGLRKTEYVPCRQSSYRC